MIQLTTTTETREDALMIARHLVEQSYAACVQIVGPITSVYRWKGKIEETEEWRCEVKTRRELFPDVRDAIAKAHPYDEPEIIAFEIDQASTGYRQWVFDSTQGTKES